MPAASSTSATACCAQWLPIHGRAVHNHMRETPPGVLRALPPQPRRRHAGASMCRSAAVHFRHGTTAAALCAVPHGSCTPSPWARCCAGALRARRQRQARIAGGRGSGGRGGGGPWGARAGRVRGQGAGRGCPAGGAAGAPGALGGRTWWWAGRGRSAPPCSVLDRSGKTQRHIGFAKGPPFHY